MVQLFKLFSLINIRTYVLILASVSVIGGIVSSGFFIYFLAKISSIVDLQESNTASSSNDMVRATGILTLFLLVGIALALVHIIFSCFPFLAEYQQNPRWLIPWIGYLYLSLVIGIVLFFRSIISQDFVSSLMDIAGIGFTYVALTLTRKRRAEMEPVVEQNFQAWL